MNIKTFWKDNKASILFGAGITASIISVIEAVRQTPKALQSIESAKKEQKVDKLTAWETVKATWKDFAPVIVTELIAVTCLSASDIAHERTRAALFDAYTLSEAAFKAYSDKVVETLGEKKEQQVRDAIAEEELKKHPVNNAEVIITGIGNTLCFDKLSGRYFTSSIESLRRVQNDLNAELNTGLQECVSENEYYASIGLEDLPGGDDRGWNLEVTGLLDFSFSSKLAENGEPCLVIQQRTRPIMF